MPRLELLSIRQHNPFTMPWRVDVCNGGIRTYDVCVLNILSYRFVRHHPMPRLELLCHREHFPDPLPAGFVLQFLRLRAHCVHQAQLLLQWLVCAGAVRRRQLLQHPLFAVTVWSLNILPHRLDRVDSVRPRQRVPDPFNSNAVQLLVLLSNSHDFSNPMRPGQRLRHSLLSGDLRQRDLLRRREHVSDAMSSGIPLYSRIRSTNAVHSRVLVSCWEC